MTDDKQEKESKFVISIIGKNIHFEVPINSLNDFENLDEILKILKKKL
jgi:hypothetical protein